MSSTSKSPSSSEPTHAERLFNALEVLPVYGTTLTVELFAFVGTGCTTSVVAVGLRSIDDICVSETTTTWDGFKRLRVWPWISAALPLTSVTLSKTTAVPYAENATVLPPMVTAPTAAVTVARLALSI